MIDPAGGPADKRHDRSDAQVTAGTIPAVTTTASDTTFLLIDASAVPGVELIVTFTPAISLNNGMRYVMGMQTVTQQVAIAFEDLLPLNWMASIQRRGEIAANQCALPCTGAPIDFAMPLAADIALAYRNGGWDIPAYDSDDQAILVGFGVGAALSVWAYAVPAAPQRTVPMRAGGYEILRSNGIDRIGGAIDDDRTGWRIPIGMQASLTFDSCGNGTLSPWIG